MTWGFLDVPMAPTPIILKLWMHGIIQTIQEQSVSTNMIVEDLQILDIELFENFGTNVRRNILKIRLSSSCKS